MRTRRITALAALAVIVLAACGSNAPKQLSDDDFLDTLSDICTTAQRSFDRIDPPQDLDDVEDAAKTSLKILNKADIADPALTQKWLAFYNAQPSVQALALSAKQAGAVKRIPERALALAPHRAKPAKPLRIMILGIPNVGKSTLMNALLRRSVTKVGNEPAVTKSQHGHQLGKNMWLIDTPGLLWPDLDQQSALKLAATHSIGPNAYDQEEVAAELARYLLQHYAQAVLSRFPALSAPESALDPIAAIALGRSLLRKGGTPDRERAARVLLGEFRDGTLGAMSLETPDASG